MPIYEYRCDACAHQFEKLQKLNADPLLECPECKSASLKKLVSAAGFRLKGSGWYETDFKSGKAKNLHASDSTEKTNKTAETKGAADKKVTQPAASSKPASTSSGEK